MIDDIRTELTERYKQPREALCVAAMLKSTLLDATWMEGNTARELILKDLDEYFTLEACEAEQFDLASTKKWIESLDKNELIQLLCDMGRSPIERVTLMSHWRWQLFVDCLVTGREAA